MTENLESVDDVVEDLVRDLGKPPRIKPRDWSWMDTPEKARAYCDEHFAGQSRGQVSIAYGALYAAIRRRGWLEDVFPESFHKNYRDWSWMKTPEKAREHYEDNFKGLNRNEVKKEDLGFYDKVKTSGWLDNVFPESSHADRRDWSVFDLEMVQDYYEENFLGLSRYEVQKKDPPFYHKVLKSGWLDDVFPKSANSHYRYWSGFDIERTKQYYQEYFDGKSRKEVQMEDVGFYGFVRKKGWLDEVFPPRLK